jgi:VWFA-related protein
MNGRRPSPRSIALIIAAFTIALVQSASPGQNPPPNQQLPAFKSGVTMVPLDVRVVDKDGRPITDLKREDFTILENGVPQPLAHFVAQVLEADAPAPGLRASPKAAPFDTAPQTRRVFLILLGPGALGDTRAHPETLDALLRFIRQSLLPQDQVGLIAFNRAVDFTTDHEKVARLLEMFRGTATTARSAMARQGSLAAADVGSVFADPPAVDTPPSIEAELGLEDYVKARRGQSQSEIDALTSGINYLRYVAGEKHLIFVTASGPVPTWDQMKRVTSSASHARVALDTIQTGERVKDLNVPNNADPVTVEPRPDMGYVGAGTSSEGRPPPLGRQGQMLWGAAAGRPPADGLNADRVIDHSQEPGGAPISGGNSLEGAVPSIYDLKYMAQQTGGQASLLKEASQTLDRIDAATRSQYLLAYYPIDGNWNGQYRSVKVEVNRPGATVLFRHGYYARREADVFDRRRVVSNNRVESAGYQLDPVREIDVAFTPRFVKSEKGDGGNVFLTVRVDTSRMAWGTDEGGRHTASLEVAVYCGDGNQKIVGQARRQLSIALTDATFQRVTSEGFFRDVGVPVTTKPRNVKVIVYDYDADRVGSAIVRIK